MTSVVVVSKTFGIVKLDITTKDRRKSEFTAWMAGRANILVALDSKYITI